MKINVNTKTTIPKTTTDTAKHETRLATTHARNSVYTRRSFFSKFLQVCIEDIEKRFAPFRKKKKWDGKVPKIEPRYK